MFTILLNGNQDEREPSGGGIMASPYANYCYRLADNSKIIAKLEKLLKGKPKLLEQLEKAIEGVYLKTFTSDYGDYGRYCIQWLGVEIHYPKRSFNSADYNKENVMKWIRESEFYQMVAQMKR